MDPPADVAPSLCPTLGMPLRIISTDHSTSSHVYNVYQIYKLLLPKPYEDNVVEVLSLATWRVNSLNNLYQVPYGVKVGETFSRDKFIHFSLTKIPRQHPVYNIVFPGIFLQLTNLSGTRCMEALVANHEPIHGLLNSFLHISILKRPFNLICFGNER